MAVNGVVENINTLANATVAIGGDILEDASNARDEAEISASGAAASATAALANELLAKDWAEKGHNNPVTGVAGIDAEYSAYHWKEETRVLAEAGFLLNDNVTSLSYVWSSQFIQEKLNLKADITHTHAGMYEPTIGAKGTAFNKDFGYTASDVAYGYHLHNGANGSVSYEPAIGTKYTGFNLNIGTDAGTLAEGNHTHNYEPAFSKNSAFNKNFVVDTANPTSSEIPRGNHTHTAAGVSYDNTSALSINSGTVQGAIDSLDSIVGVIEISDKTYGTLALDGSTSDVTISTADTWTRVTALTKTAGTMNNMISPSTSRLAFDYDDDTENLIEARFSANITVSVPTANTQMALTAYKVPLDTGVAEAIHTDWFGDITSIDSTATSTITLTGYLTGFENGDAIELYIKNISNTDNITVHSLTMVVDGGPEGSLISPTTVIDHSDLTGTGAANGVHTMSDIEGLVTELNTKAETDHEHTISEITDLDLSTKQDLVIPAVTGNIATLDGTGHITDGGALLASKAEIGGSSSQLFEVANGTTGNEAINYTQLSTLTTTVDGKIPQVTTPTEGSFPKLDSNGNLVDSIYDETTFATATHGHTINEITSLQTTLDLKYAKVTTPITNNITTFGAGNVLQDSGISVTGSQLTGELV